MHIVFADKSGASVVVGAYNEQIVLHKRSAQSYQLLTNFNLSDPSYGNEPKCTRYHTALGMLQKDTSATVENMLSILSQTHQQELTSYSTIYDLSNQDVYIFNKADFKHYKKFNLSQALNKGKSQILIGSLFP